MLVLSDAARIFTASVIFGCVAFTTGVIGCCQILLLVLSDAL